MYCEVDGDDVRLSSAGCRPARYDWAVRNGAHGAFRFCDLGGPWWADSPAGGWRTEVWSRGSGRRPGAGDGSSASGRKYCPGDLITSGSAGQYL